MKKSLIVIIVLALVVVIFYGFFKSTYNTMVQNSEQVDASWAQVQNVYQRRADLIPNLVSTVKGYAAHEQEVLTGVVEARAKATSVNLNAENLTEANMKAFQQAQEGLSGALSRLMVVVERYPDLKANQNYLQLQGQLEGIENDIRASRQTFNTAINSYNTKVRSFPMNILGSLFGFKAKEGFKADEGADKAPKVEF